MKLETMVFGIVAIGLLGILAGAKFDQEHELKMAEQGLCKYEREWVKCKDKKE